QRIEKAAAVGLDLSLDVVREALVVGSHFLTLAPVVPGLREAVETLLVVWDSCRLVERNKVACFKLTERCADILLSIKAELDSAGVAVAGELSEPIEKLTDAFKKVQALLQRQSQRHLLLRYLKREEFVREIAGCDKALSGALDMFAMAIQFRIFKQIQANEVKRQRDAECLLESL
ncbi:hypothetical protein NEOLEDRAFT_1042462, partial [Neolentinus lepideus HHB14362 ss-1]